MNPLLLALLMNKFSYGIMEVTHMMEAGLRRENCIKLDYVPGYISI
jgi:hypothetical protein